MIAQQHYIHLKSGREYKTHGLFDTYCSVKLYGNIWVVSKKYNGHELENKKLFKMT